MELLIELIIGARRCLRPYIQREQKQQSYDNQLEDYQPFFEKWDAETMANTGLTLCHQVDTMLNRHLRTLEQEFVEQGGIKERMHAARTGYRQQQDAELQQLRLLVPQLQAEIASLKKKLQDHGIDYNL